MRSFAADPANATQISPANTANAAQPTPVQPVSANAATAPVDAANAAMANTTQAQDNLTQDNTSQAAASAKAEAKTASVGSRMVATKPLISAMAMVLKASTLAMDFDMSNFRSRVFQRDGPYESRLREGRFIGRYVDPTDQHKAGKRCE